MSIEIVNSLEARTRWRDLLDKVLARGVNILFESYGKPVAVMIPVEVALIEGCDELEDTKCSHLFSTIAWKKTQRQKLVGSNRLR